MIQLPPTIPTVDFQGDFASKQAKLEQLHAMQEAVRRMEHELQLEGVFMWVQVLSLLAKLVD